MGIPSHILINVSIFFIIFIILSFILSLTASKGCKFHSCSGEDKDSCCKSSQTAQRILSLIDKERGK